MRSIETNFARLCSFIMCIFVFVMSTVPVPVNAAEISEKKVIRIGAPEISYDTVTENGERTGYGYEYLQKIANYTGWEYEYVPCTWDNCFDQLQNGEFDILEAISYTDERSQRMEFSKLSMDDEKYYIFAQVGEADISISDLSSLDGKRIGVFVDHLPEEQLDVWENENNIHTTHINVSSKEEVLEKIENKEIDCFVSVEANYWGEYGIASVTCIGGSDVYFALQKGNRELKEELDNAMRRIADEYPSFTADLHKRYFAEESMPVLTKEEQVWLAEHGAIRIGYLKNDGGISTLKSDTGELVGVINDYVRLAEKSLYGQDLHFELKAYNLRQDMLNALHNNEIDLVFHVTQNPYYAEMGGYDLSETTWTTNMAAVSIANTFDEEADNTVAVLSERNAIEAYILWNYPKWKIVKYDSMDEIEKAARDGEVDCFVVESKDAEEYVKNHNCYAFLLSNSNRAAFAVESGNINLLSILNKTLKTISSAKLSGAVIMYNNHLKKVTVMNFVKDNLGTAIVGSGIIILLIFAVILYALRKSKIAEKKAKDAQKKAELADASKSRFLSNMSHDMRTPINGIVGMLEVMERQKDDSEAIENCVKKIDSSSKLLISLINDVLDMAKLESNANVIEDESVNIGKVCEEVAEAVFYQADDAGITLSAEYDDYTELNVISSDLYLKKIFLNLFSNAVKYNKKNGSIHMGMKILEKTTDQVVCEFKMSDTGIGMTEDFIKNQLFVPFAQEGDSARTKYNGTGLGMPMVKEIVDKMGGTISVESTLGEGSTFTVVLPFRIDHNYNHDVQVETKITDCSIKGMKLLLAEDNELNVEIAEALLEDEGASVVVAQNGKLAVEIFEQNPEGTFDAIIMDVMMPEMDGLAATRKIRELDRTDSGSIPIIAMTANAFTADEDKCLAAGMNAHLIKPLDIEAIKNALCELIN